MASVLETVKVPPIGISRKYPELGTGPVPTDIYHDPAIYEKEIEAIFKRCWPMLMPAGRWWKWRAWKKPPE